MPLDYKIKIAELEQELARYKRLSLVDSLTGIYNRRKLDLDLKRYCELNKRYHLKFMVLMIDLNNFKKLNDTKGHKFGDLYLKRLAKILKSGIRKYESVYRLGGDEIVIICSHFYKMEKVVKRIKKLLDHNKIDASLGYSFIGKNCLEVADKMMYKHKKENVR